MSYGNKGNEELLFQYGFSITENPQDTVMVLSPLSQEDPLFSDKVGLLQALGYGPRMMFDSAGELDATSAEVARITVLDDGDLGAIGDKIALLEKSGSWTPGPVTPENERRMAEVLTALLEQYLARLHEISITASEIQDSLNLRFLSYYCAGQIKATKAALTNLANLK